MATKPFLRGSPEEAIRAKKAARMYFYLDGKLYKKLRVDNGHDSMICWDYAAEHTVELPLSYVKKKRKPSYTMVQVAVMLGRSRMKTNHVYMQGLVMKPQKSYPINRPDMRDKGTYRLSEEDVYRLHDYYLSMGRKKLPSRQQLASMMRYEKIQYVQTKDGEFVPLWQAPDIEEWL